MNDGSKLRDDFLLDLEEAVGIRLTEAEWRACRTVGDAERLVGERVSLDGPARPLLPVARERTRAALAAALGRDVALDAELERAFPRAGRVDRWERFQRALGSSVGSVRRPEWVRAVVLFAVLMTGYLLFVFSQAEYLFHRWYDYLTWDVIAGGALAAGALAYVLTRFVAIRVPYETGETVARMLVADAGDHARLNGGDRRWSPVQVREVLAILVELHYGVKGALPSMPLSRGHGER